MSIANNREPRMLSLHVRCSHAERMRWLAKARSHCLSLSDYLREYMEMSPTSRRSTAPPVNPMLITQIARAGNNLNQIAKAANTSRRLGDEIDMIAVLAELVAIDRALCQLTREFSK